MRSTTRARLAMCRGEFVSIDAEIEAKRRQLGLADDAPESKSAPAAGPKLMASTRGARPISKTTLPDGRVVLDIADVCVDLSPKEARTLGLLFASVADDIVRAAGYRPPGEDAAPSMAVAPPKPRPLPPSTAARPISLTNLPDGRAILEIGDARIDFSEREIEVLTWMLAPKVPKAPVSDWRT